MKRPSNKKRVSKAEWLARALEVLADEGIQGIRVERLARDLGIAKAGFYWHFRDRRDLLRNMLDYWKDEFTTVVTGNIDLQAGDAKRRLDKTTTMIVEHDLAKYDLAIRAWATHDPEAAKAVKAVYRMRHDFIRQIFADLGFRGQQLEMRTQLCVCYHTWEHMILFDLPKDELHKLLRLQNKLLATK